VADRSTRSLDFIPQQEALVKLIGIAVLLGMTTSGIAAADQSGVQFEVVLTRDGKVVSSPTFIGQFGKTVGVELGQTMKVDAVASAPDKDGNSFTSVKLQLFENGEMRPLKEMSMLADLSKTPSIEYSVPGTNARITFRPRLAKLPEAKKG
jgi:hypothetical protein